MSRPSPKHGRPCRPEAQGILMGAASWRCGVDVAIRRCRLGGALQDSSRSRDSKRQWKRLSWTFCGTLKFPGRPCFTQWWSLCCRVARARFQAHCHRHDRDPGPNSGNNWVGDINVQTLHQLRGQTTGDLFQVRQDFLDRGMT